MVINGFGEKGEKMGMTMEKLDLLPDEAFEKAAECLKVMAHPARLKMVNILMQGEFAVKRDRRGVQRQPQSGM
jgi:hypothetical protein